MSSWTSPPFRPIEPYRGLEPYRFCDQSIFFEREEEAARLARLVLTYRGSLLYGESGAGKSSLINAGLIPKLLAAGMSVERLRVEPRRNAEFIVERIPCSPKEGDFLPSVLLESGDKPRPAFSVADFLDRIRSESRPELLLILDQFEELLTLASHQPSEAMPRGASFTFRRR